MPVAVIVRQPFSDSQRHVHPCLEYIANPVKFNPLIHTAQFQRHPPLTVSLMMHQFHHRVLYCVCNCFLLLDATAIAAAEAILQYPVAIAATEDRIYIADRKANLIWVVQGQQMRVYFQGPSDLKSPLRLIQSLAVDQHGHLLAGDSATRDVYRFDKEKRPVPLTRGQIGIPSGIAVGRDGTIIVSDLETQRLWQLSKDGGAPEEIAAIEAPRAIAFDFDNRLWVVSHGRNQVLRREIDGSWEVVVPGRPLEFPAGIAIDKQQNAFVTDAYGGTIWKIPASKVAVKLAVGEGLLHPAGAAWLQSELLVSDAKAKAIFRVGMDGSVRKLHTPVEE